MPIHLAPLPPLSRRRFLTRTLAAGAGLVLGPDLLAAGKTDENSWALFSDIHLAADRKLNARGINMTEHFETVASELVALPRRPVGLFITGDCAYNSGETADYAVVADLLKPIRKRGLPVHIALGNHDNRERFWDAFAAEKTAKRPLADRQVALLKAPSVNWFILDSLEKTLSTPGLLGPEQLDWLARTLDANPNKPAIVLVHHNPGIDGSVSGLKDTFEFLEIIHPRKQVKAYIYGHTHVWNVQTDKTGLHLVNLPPVAYVFREGMPSGWVKASVQPDGMSLELRCIDPTHKDHAQVVNLKWRA